MKRLATVLFAIASMLSAGLASAATITAQYSVHSTSVVNCSGAPHGLWTQSYLSGSCANFFDIDDNTLFTQYDDGTATLIGSATNPFGTTAYIDIFLDDFIEATSVYKKEGGANYDHLTDSPDIDFYSTLVGTITIDGAVFNVTPFAYYFQFGLGANAKSATEFGGSSWLDPAEYDPKNPNAHWDLNLTFTEVPEAGSLALLAIGLLGLGLTVRRRA